MAAPRTSRVSKLALISAILFLGAACAGPGEVPTTAQASMVASEAGREGPEILRLMIDAHGGMERWTSAPTVSFEDHFIPAGAPSGQPSRVMVEQGRRRAYIDFPRTEMRMAWDGERAWSNNWHSPMPPRLLAQMNYYFLNLPWLVNDPGVHHSEPGTEKLWNDPIDYITVEMTFAEGTGDTPDDYYVLYINPKTHLLKACRYVVTYRALLPDGASATPEHILVYDAYTEVDGLTVPTKYTVHETDQSVYATCEIRDWSFTQRFDTARMVMPEGAELDTSTP